MPALDIHHPKANEPSFEHVYVNVLDEDHTRSTLSDVLSFSNLMVDTFIANADPEELRGIVRNLLASSPPSVSTRLATIARSRLKHKLSGRGSPAFPSSQLFLTSKDGSSRPADHFYQTLRAARSMYGAGLGFMALRHLTPAMQQTIGLRWEEDDEMADSLAILDSDMTQAIQSGKEELLREKGAVANEARAIVKELRLRLSEASASVKSWGGEFPFERTQASLEHWKL